MNDHLSTSVQKRKVGDYILEERIGVGSFGSVWRALHIPTGATYAIKMLDKNKYHKNPILMKLLSTEISVMHKIKHDNILHLYDYLESSKSYYLVIDFCNKGDLESLMKRTSQFKFDEKTSVFYLKQIINGFQELRRHKVLHRDLKLANIFMNDETILIGDFGFAKSGQDVAQTRLGTPLTMAPEILMYQDDSPNYGAKADLWSIGVVFYEMLFGNSPFFAISEAEIMLKIKKNSGEMLKFPSEISDESKSLIRGLLQIDPAKRLEWEDVFDHTVFRKFTRSNELATDTQFNLGRLVLNDRVVVDAEFAQNRGKTQQFSGFADMEELADEHLFLPFNVQEEAIGPRSLEHLFCEIEFRYNHEKNKILFFIFTVRHIAQILRTNKFEPVAEAFFNTKLLVLKKAVVMNYLDWVNLVHKINNFDIPEKYFSDFLESEFFGKVCSTFESDHENMREILQSLVKTVPETSSLYETLQTPLVQLEELDELIYEEYLNLKEFAENVQNDQQDEFYRTLFYISCSIYSEKSFQYVYQDQKFSWEHFYKNLKAYTAKDLATIII